MTTALAEQIVTALAQLSSASRLYGFVIEDSGIDLGPGGLLVEAFTGEDAVNGICTHDVIVLSTSAYVE